MKFRKPKIAYVLADSMDRPAWTSTQETGMFEAFKHKHSIYRGKFYLQKNYYD